MSAVATPYFAAALPFSQRVDPIRIVSDVAARATAEEVRRYDLAGLRQDAPDFDMKFGLDYVDSQDETMRERYDPQASGLTPARSGELFQLTCKCTLSPDGLLVIRFDLPPSWEPAEHEVARKVLSFHLYHFAKHFAQLARDSNVVIPGIEVRKWMTSLSSSPEQDLITFLEESIRSTHHEVLGGSLLHIQQLRGMCTSRRSRVRFVAETIRHGTPWKLVLYARRRCYHQRTALYWNYHILLRALTAAPVEERLRPHIERVSHDFAEIEKHSDFLSSRFTDLGAAFAIVIGSLGTAAGLAIAVGPNAVGAAFLALLATAIAGYGVHSMETVVTSIQTEAEAILQVFARFEEEEEAPIRRRRITSTVLAVPSPIRFVNGPNRP